MGGRNRDRKESKCQEVTGNTSPMHGLEESILGANITHERRGFPSVVFVFHDETGENRIRWPLWPKKIA